MCHIASPIRENFTQAGLRQATVIENIMVVVLLRDDFAAIANIGRVFGSGTV
jgi:hypothetical protein